MDLRSDRRPVRTARGCHTNPMNSVVSVYAGSVGESVTQPFTKRASRSGFPGRTAASVDRRRDLAAPAGVVPAKPE
ncbi:hypothetical protein MPRG_57180 [Mycobacterium paragordonae]|uniref:Uncharacterized protein n=1 Tax=Mycobacterium paragordonae TaxID=1389713 RepID=A0ABQ1CDQ2_9MYCO|nr:hypothetical protein MPRG_57180 [Mycobacterium paragordonae]